MKKFLNYFKNFSLSFLLIFSLFTNFAYAETTYPSPTNYKYINDYIDLVDTSTKEKIVSIGKELEDKTGAQAIIVIVDTIENDTIANYSNKLFRAWGIGEEDKDNGLLILLALEDRTYRVEVGRGLEGAIPDLLSSKVMDNEAKPYFQNDDYSTGLLNSYSYFADLIAEEYGTTLDKSQNISLPQDNYVSNNDRGLLGNIISNFSSFIVIGFILLDLIFNRGRITSTILKLLFISSGRGPRGGGGGGGFGGGSSGGGFGSFGGGSSNGGGSSGKW